MNRLPIHLLILWATVAGFVANATCAQAAEAKAKKPADLAAKKGDANPEDAEPKTVEQLAELVRKSVVVVSFSGRDGKMVGLGSGFIVSADGLIATNMHVIGEARPIAVQTADGKRYDVTTIHATERLLDLALIRIDAKDLPALPLGNSDQLKQGQEIVAIGNPRGLKHSVVSGVVSGRRKIDGKPMIQLAVPIEQGNSGGPLLDMFGRVHGILTLKSLVTQNLGFAVEINSLKPLIAKPNPVPMSRWLTIGALDDKQWTQLFGANWRQRAGRILVEGRGKGFGGRALILSTNETPKLPFEIAVSVRMEQEDGAAGLVFHADGSDKHYGFYPSSGKVRLSRFDGPDVFAWKVLQEVRSPHYRPNDWNALKVRLEDGRIQCFLNDELVIESDDDGFKQGQVGLAKFRHTEAEFKQFQVGKKIESARPSKESVARITKLVADISPKEPPKPELVQQLLPDAGSSSIVLRERAKRLELQAERLRQLAAAVHQQSIRTQLAKLLTQKEDDVDLLHAALLIAKLDNDELDVEAYRSYADRLATELKTTYPKDADEKTRLAALDKFLFMELGFHGSRTNYYSRSNSYLNEVIDDREGLPIMLSVLYMEVARRIGLQVVGVGLPGHFVVRYEPKEGPGQLIDPFESGARMTREEAVAQVKARTGRPFDDEYLKAQSKQAIIIRMLYNLRGVARGSEDMEAQLSYVETMVAIDPESPEYRSYRADLRIQTSRIPAAIQDLDWFLEKKPDGVDVGRLKQLRQALEEQLPKEE